VPGGVLVLGGGLIVVALLWCLYEFVVINDGIAYYASNPGRLLYAILAGLIAGAVAVGIGRMSPKAQHRLKVAGLATLGTVLILAILAVVWVLRSAGPMPEEMGFRGWSVAGFLGWLVATVLVWLEFRRVLRQGRRQP
jgi:hypothetical protein